MKRYIVTSNETMEYYKIVEAKNERDALKKAQLHDPKNFNKKGNFWRIFD